MYQGTPSELVDRLAKLAGRFDVTGLEALACECEAGARIRIPSPATMAAQARASACRLIAESLYVELWESTLSEPCCYGRSERWEEDALGELQIAASLDEVAS